MQTKLRIQRFDPEGKVEGQYFQEFTLDIANSATVLDVLIKIREEIDGSLALRCACRASICGSCSMRVNGRACLVCKTRVSDIASCGETVTVEPMGNMKVIKDLVTDMSGFWEKMHSIQPFLQPQGDEPEAEYQVANESMVHLVGVMNCIMCGACVSDCTVLEVDDDFIGPAALAKAYRFIKDPRDGRTDRRLEFLNEPGGVWDCTRCMQCVEVCPKDVDPMERIMAMRDMGISTGVRSTPGSRHAQSFVTSVKKHGRLDEARLTIDSVGKLNVPVLLEMAPVGIAALTHGKLPIRPHKAENKDGIKRIVEDLENE